MNAWRWSRRLGILASLVAIAGSAQGQWWYVPNNSGLIAGSDNNNPPPGCSPDAYTWIVFPLWEIQITMPEAKPAGTTVTIVGELVSLAPGLVLKVDGCTGQLSYISTPGYPNGDLIWTWKPDSGTGTSGTGSGPIATAMFTPSYSGTITFEFGGPHGYRASARYRVLTNERVAYWRFNGHWIGEGGQAPTQTIGLDNPLSWNGRTLKIAGAGDVMKYPDREKDGYPNITRNVGTVRFWFKPSVVTGATRKLVDINSSAPWELRLNTSGQLQLATRPTVGGTETVHVTHTTALTANQWYLIAATYSASGSTLYVGNGMTLSLPSTSGSALTAASVSLNGFSIGNGYSSQSNAATGEFDEFETFNYVLSGSTITSDFNTVAALDSDGDGLRNLLEATVVGMYEPDTDGDGYIDGADYYITDPTRWLAPPANNPADTTPPTIELWTPLNT